jgi:hypothetical protein
VVTVAGHDERLHVPWSWWPVVGLIVLLGVFEVGSGFTWQILLIVAVFLVGFFIVPLILSGTMRVQLGDGVLRVGKDELPVMAISSVQPLDRAQTRSRLGPQADPAAHLAVRGWIGSSVLLRLANPDPVPYWVVSTRRPAELAAAITAARSRGGR